MALLAGILALVGLFALRTVVSRRAERVIGRSGGDSIVLRRRRGFRELVFVNGDVELVQSRQDLRDPLRSGWAYVDGLHAGMLVVDAPRRVLFLGGGAGLGPMQFEALYTDATIDVVEKEQVVVDVAKRHFGLRASPRVRVRVADAREVVTGCAPAEYDVVVLDAYGAYALPAALATTEFFELVRRVLTPRGVLVLNVIGDLDAPRAIARRVLATLAAAFDGFEVAVFPVGEPKDAADEAAPRGGVRNVVVLVARSIPSREELQRRAAAVSAQVVPELGAVVRSRWTGDVRGGRVLTDGELAAGPALIPVE
jgi:spermidine synthase